MPGLLGAQPAPPQLPSNGLLQRVIWDRIRAAHGLLHTPDVLQQQQLQQQNLPLLGGGGPGPNVKISAPEPVKEPAPKPQLNWRKTGGGNVNSTLTPSGVGVSIFRDPEANAGSSGEVIFSDRSPTSTYGYPGGKGSTKRGIGRFGEVFNALKDYVTSFEPKHLYFSGASPAHMKIYDRMAPDLAKSLGGELQSAHNYYRIFFPQNGGTPERGLD